MQPGKDDITEFNTSMLPIKFGTQSTEKGPDTFQTRLLVSQKVIKLRKERAILRAIAILTHLSGFNFTVLEIQLFFLLPQENCLSYFLRPLQFGTNNTQNVHDLRVNRRKVR